MARPVQCVVSPGGSASVRATIRSPTSGPNGAMRDGRVLSRRRPSTPSAAKRSCQRQTAVLLLPVRRMMAAVPRPSAVASTSGAPDVLLRAVAVRHDGSKPVAVRGGHVDDDPGAHAPDSHAIIATGIPKRTLPSPSIHYVGRETYLTTSNNAFSDALLPVRTLLEPGSELFVRASGLKEGQLVAFSG